MAGLPKISNPFEDETDFIDRTDPQDIAKQAAQQAGNAAMKHVVKPVAKVVSDVSDQSIVDFLYGATPSADTSGDPNAQSSGSTPQDAGIEHVAGQQLTPQQLAKLQQVDDPDQQMAQAEKAQLTEEQLEQRERNRLHIRNYYTTANKLDDIGTLEEQVAKARQQREQEEQQRKQEEEEEEMRKKEEEEAKRQQIAMPSGKKTGVPQETLKREQNKTENKTGFSG